MSDEQYRGILHGVTEVPGCERPVVDGELCEQVHVVRISGIGQPSPAHSYCDACDQWKVNGDQWKHTMLYSECPECVEVKS